MRCSPSESRLDEYVDGALAFADHARVARHVAQCPDCAALLVELRSIDALLLAPRRLEPAPNLRFRVMADVRSLPAPQPHHRFSFALLGLYVAFGWSAIAAFLMCGGIPSHLTVASFVNQVIATSGILTSAVGHVFGRQTLGVTAAMGAVLSVDVVAAALVFGAFVIVRARRRAELQSVETC